MKNFKDRVKQLLSVTTNEDVRVACNKVSEMQGYANESGLRDMLVADLKGLELGESEKKFLAVEKKLTVLDTMGLAEAFNAIYEGDILKDNPGLGYPVNALHAAYKANNATAIALAEGLINVLQPYTFNPIIENQVKHMKSLMETYAEDIAVVSAIDKIQRLRTGYFYGEVIEKLGTYLLDKDAMSRRELIVDLQKFAYEPLVQETLRSLIAFEENNSLYIVNENKSFKVAPIYSFMYFDPEVKEKYYFANMGSIFLKEADGSIRLLDENEAATMPLTFRQINGYITKPNVKITKDTVSIFLEKGNIDFVMKDGANEAFLNGIRMEVAPYQYLIQSGLFGYGVQEELQTIGKIWEHLDLLVEVDYGKNILSSVYPGVSATLYKSNEQFFVQLRNLPARTNKMLSNVNGLQARNEILEFMKYDITESLFSYLEGPEAEIAKLRADQKVIESDILNITTQIAKIDGAMRDPMIGENEELVKVKDALVEEVGFLKGKYNEIQEDIVNLGKANELDINEKEDLRPGSSVKMKSSGIIGKVVAINTVTKSVSVLTDDGDTVSTTVDDVEQIDGTIAKNLGDIESKAKEVEKTQAGVKESALTEGQLLFGSFAAQVSDENKAIKEILDAK